MTTPAEELLEMVAREIDAWPFSIVANISHTERAAADREKALAKARTIIAMIAAAPPVDGGWEEQGSSTETERGDGALPVPSPTQSPVGWSISFSDLESLHAAIAGVVTANERWTLDEEDRWKRLGAWLARLAVAANERFPGNWKGLPADHSADDGAPMRHEVKRVMDPKSNGEKVDG